MCKTTEQVRQFEKECSKENKQFALDLLTNFTEDCYDTLDFKSIEWFIDSLDKRIIPTEMLISVLRATGRARKFISSWNNLLNYVEQRVEDENLPKRLLRGLN